MSGAEIQANAIHTVLQGFPLRSAPPWLNVLAIWILALTPPLLGLRLTSLLTIAVSAVIGGLYAVATQVAFEHGTILAFIYPMGALVISMVGGLGAYYMLAAFDRQRTRNTFARFVPEDVVDQVLAQTGGELRLGGVRVVGTCMFADLRGSTQFAESLPPETVVDVINRYLSALTESILGHGGTLISYLGDGFMAVFGAPIPQDDHADRAVAAAREILERAAAPVQRVAARAGLRRGLHDRDRDQHRPVHGGKRRLREAARVHRDGRHDQHRVPARGVDEGVRLLCVDRGLDARGARRTRRRRPGGGRRGRCPRPQEKITIWSIEAARKPERTASGSIAVGVPDL